MSQSQPVTQIDALIQRAIDGFTDQFGASPTLAAQAPGRVNLIGEHTDYNDGFVMPLALPMRTVIVGSITESDECRLVAGDLNDEMHTFKLSEVTPGDTMWANYIMGVIAQFLKNDYELKSFDAYVVSNVPMGGGLSSSAALEVATATLLEQMLGTTIQGEQKAFWAQAAEHEYAGMPCGIMDQFISAKGVLGHAMLLDCRSQETRMVKLDDPSLRIIIANSNVKHELTGGEYAERRAQCEQAVEALKRHLPDIDALRDVNKEQVELIKTEVDHVIYQRARHVVGENERTLAAADALDSGDYVKAGLLMYQSHESLRDDFEVSTPELDALVDLAGQIKGVYGSRMTGGGFGGCTVSLVHESAVDALVDKIESEYEKISGQPASIYTVVPSVGTQQIAL